MFRWNKPDRFDQSARISLTLDIGFGDAPEPRAEVLTYPSMLDFPVPGLPSLSAGNGHCREPRGDGDALAVPTAA
ncbi:hypothetical protein ATY79_10950 [Rhizobium sp. R693]|nr:hypothetical protein ATY79_10950 [Rhizobium sp. R693]